MLLALFELLTIAACLDGSMSLGDGEMAAEELQIREESESLCASEIAPSSTVRDLSSGSSEVTSTADDFSDEQAFAIVIALRQQLRKLESRPPDGTTAQKETADSSENAKDADIVSQVAAENQKQDVVDDNAGGSSNAATKDETDEAGTKREPPVVENTTEEPVVAQVTKKDNATEATEEPAQQVAQETQKDNATQQEKETADESEQRSKQAEKTEQSATCANGLTSILTWAASTFTSPGCKVSHAHKPCCPNNTLREDVTRWTIGVHAEILASVATGGQAKTTGSWDLPLEMSDDAVAISEISYALPGMISQTNNGIPLAVGQNGAYGMSFFKGGTWGDHPDPLQCSLQPRFFDQQCSHWSWNSSVQAMLDPSKPS